jgi:hypothetical protein
VTGSRELQTVALRSRGCSTPRPNRASDTGCSRRPHPGRAEGAAGLPVRPAYDLGRSLLSAAAGLRAGRGALRRVTCGVLVAGVRPACAVRALVAGARARALRFATARRAGCCLIGRACLDLGALGCAWPSRVLIPAAWACRRNFFQVLCAALATLRARRVSRLASFSALRASLTACLAVRNRRAAASSCSCIRRSASAGTLLRAARASAPLPLRILVRGNSSSSECTCGLTEPPVRCQHRKSYPQKLCITGWRTGCWSAKDAGAAMACIKVREFSPRAGCHHGERSTAPCRWRARLTFILAAHAAHPARRGPCHCITRGRVGAGAPASA